VVTEQPLLSQLLADDLGLSQADIIAHIDHFFGRPHGLTDTEIISIVRDDLDPWCIRSWPDGFYGSSEPQDLNVCRCVALGGREHSPGPDCPPDRGRRGLTGGKEEQE
jgi:hypothetical protein